MLYFFVNDTSTTQIYTLSLHDALPIYGRTLAPPPIAAQPARGTQRKKRVATTSAATPHAAITARCASSMPVPVVAGRSEEHTSELQSLAYLVCRLLLEKKKQNTVVSLH